MRALIYAIIIFIFLFTLVICDLAESHGVHVEPAYRSSANLVSRYATPYGSYYIFLDVDNDGSVDIVDEILLQRGTSHWHIIDTMSPKTALDRIKGFEGEGESF
ncbi:MAG: hypothetical protein ACYTE8_01015 [Planctomycetota bacterium]|jgi:hypothetical protein